MSPLWISEREVVGLLDMGEAISALQRGLQLEAEGKAQNMVKTHVAMSGGGTLHAIGAVIPGEKTAGTKTWAHTERGATPLLVLFDTETGAMRAIIEAFALGQMRTGGMSGVATALLAPPAADDLALIGTGKQALPQLAAVAAVRRLRRVRVFSRDAAGREAFARKAAQELELSIEPAASVEAAVEGASIITLVTRATRAFLFSRLVAKGAHLNAVGAITPERAEFEPGLLSRAALVAVDSVAQVQRLSSEFIAHYGSDESAWRAVVPLCQVASGSARKASSGDITVFKAMGVGISDLSLGVEIYRRALEQSVGRPIAAHERVAPRLRPRIPPRT